MDDPPPPGVFTEAVACAWLGGAVGMFVAGGSILLGFEPANPHVHPASPGAFLCLAVASLILPTLLSVPAGCAVGRWARRTGRSPRETRPEAFAAGVAAGAATAAVVCLLPPVALMLLWDGRS